MPIILVSPVYPDNIPSYPQFSSWKLLHGYHRDWWQPSCFLSSGYEPISSWLLDICCRSPWWCLVHSWDSDAVPRYPPHDHSPPTWSGIRSLVLFFFLLTLPQHCIQAILPAILALGAWVWIATNTWVDDMMIIRLRWTLDECDSRI